MAKKPLLSVAPKSEFTAAVPIPTPDRDPEMIEFTFKYRDRQSLDAWITSMDAKAQEAETPIDADVAMVLECVTDWGFEEPLDANSVRSLLVQNAGAAFEIHRTYVALCRLGKRKN